MRTVASDCPVQKDLCGLSFIVYLLEVSARTGPFPKMEMPTGYVLSRKVSTAREDH
jgi:hypothetical protein